MCLSRFSRNLVAKASKTLDSPTIPLKQPPSLPPRIPTPVAGKGKGKNVSKITTSQKKEKKVIAPDPSCIPGFQEKRANQPVTSDAEPQSVPNAISPQFLTLQDLETQMLANSNSPQLGSSSTPGSAAYPPHQVNGNLDQQPMTAGAFFASLSSNPISCTPPMSSVKRCLTQTILSSLSVCLFFFVSTLRTRKTLITPS